MLEVGRVLSRRYEILEEIGSGGMAIVYKARDYKLGRMVAIKVLKQEMTLDETILSKFKKEALAAGSLTHPNIVAVYDLGHEIGCDYIVMEYIDGITLKEYIRRRDMLSSEEVLKISIRIAEALKTAHENGIIHRDIKPQNIMVTPSGDVKVTDFGIAKAASSTTATSTGETLGSVHYLSPEQARGGDVDKRSDLYSLGITMYEMATKKLPFTAETPVAVAMKQVHEAFPNPAESAPQLWMGLCDIIIKLTQKKLEYRYQTADELIRDMKHLYRNHHYRLENKAPGQASYGRTAAEVKAEQEKERRRLNKEREDRMKKAKRRKQTQALLIVLCLILAAVLIFLVVYVLRQAREGGENSSISSSSQSSSLLPNSSNATSMTPVPSLIGKSYEEAKAAVEGKLAIELETVHSEESAGTVVGQRPEGGTEAVIGETILLTVSLGPEEQLVRVPDLSNLLEEEAKSYLLETGLDIGEVSTAYNNYVARGRVIYQGTDPTVQVTRGTKIDITVSLGPQETESQPSESGTVTIANPFTEETGSGRLRVSAVTLEGGESTVFDNNVSYSTFQTLGGSMRVSYPSGTVRVDIYLNGEMIKSETVHE